MMRRSFLMHVKKGNLENFAQLKGLRDQIPFENIRNGGDHGITTVKR